MKFTFFGQSTFLLETMGKNIVFDPFLTGNPLAEKYGPDDLKADYVLVSHGHDDHCTDALAIAQNNKATIVSNWEIVGWYSKHGHEKCHPMNHGGAWNFDFGRLKMVNAVHTSSMPDGSYGGNPCGFVLENEEGSIYFAGDTALTMDMQLIGMQHKLDLALLPIGDNFTMGYEDAAIAADFVKCDRIIGMHYNTFGFIEIDTAAAIEAFKAKNKELILLDIGESFSL